MKRHEVECPNCQEKIKLDQSKTQFNCTACDEKIGHQGKAGQNLKQEVASDVLGKPYIQRKPSRTKVTNSNSKIKHFPQSDLSPQVRHYLKAQDRKKILTTDRKREQYTSCISCRLPRSRYPNTINWTLNRALLHAANVNMAILAFALYLFLVISLFISLIYHLYIGFFRLSELTGRDFILDLTYYLGLFIIGAIVLGFLLKPFFVPTFKPLSRTVKRKDQPLLFDFVDRIATYTGLERPARIEFCQLAELKIYNYGAQRRLVIGLPQLASWDTRQFAAKLVQVFGNTAQVSNITTLRILDRLIIWWDERVNCYDLVDLQIMRQFKIKKTGDRKKLLRSVLQPMALAYWFGAVACRKLFQIFYYATRYLGSGIMRQLSLVTEEMTTHLVGTAGVESLIISQGYQKQSYPLAISQAIVSQRTGSSIQDFAELFVLQHELLGDADDQIRREIKQQKTRRTDLMNCGNVQIRNARLNETEGVFKAEFPASDLIFNYRVISSTSTKDMMSEIEQWDWELIARWGLHK